MKRKYKRILRSFIALVLTAACITSSTTYAAVTPGSNPDGTINNIPADAGVCEPGVLLYIGTVKNKTTDTVKKAIAEKEEAYKANPGNIIWYDEIGWQVIKDHMRNCPEQIANPATSDLNERGVLIVRDTGTDGRYSGVDIKTGITHQFMTQVGTPQQEEIQNVYVVPRTTCSRSTLSFNLISKKITDDGLVDDFYQDYPKQVTMEYINSYVASNKTKMDAAVDNFVYHFRDTGTLASHLKTLLKENRNLEEDIAKKNLLQYLDLLVLINYMSGGKNDDVVKAFLATKNRNGSDEFAVVFMGAMMSWGDNKNFTWMSFPANMYAAFSGRTLDDYGSLTCSTFEEADALKQKESAIEYTSANPKYAEEYWQALVDDDDVKVAFNTNAKFRRGANIARMWFTTAQCNKYGSGVGTGLGTVFTLMPTDIFGRMKGALGYTYFSTAGIALPSIPTGEGGQISLKVISSKDTTVEEGGKTSVTYEISLKSAPGQITELEKLFDYAEEIGKQVNVTVEVKGKATLGSPTNSSYYDTVLTGQTISGGKISFANISFDDIKPYLAGENVIRINDSDISIKAPTRIRYQATCTLKVGSGTTEEEPTVKFEALGAEKAKDDEGEFTVAQDSWYCGYSELESESVVQTKVHYYSEPETPYVEIKQGSPTHETYEAMAGVPTTENLYLGFGATEFIINLEAEYKQQDDAKRKYTTTYTASKCYDGDHNCVYSCPCSMQ